MQIHLRTGIGALRFGMMREEIVRLIGKPDVEKHDSDDENEFFWEYNDLKLRLTFYANEGFRLGYIRSSHRNLSLNNQKLIDKKIDKVLGELKEELESWELDEYDLFTVYFNEQNWLSLNVEYQRITDFEMGVPINNEDEYEWPN